MQQIRSSAFGAGIRGFGWKASEAFSPASLAQRSPKKKREAMLKAAIRRIKLAKEGDASGDGNV